jgi:alpha-glucosidase/alpha-D-xyloside xylohydrolase
MRARWLHYPDDSAAVARGDEYLGGRDVLVAPVVEKGATIRRVYLPKGDWFDFWTNERMTGGKEVERSVDLAIVPMYVRAGAVIPTGPVKQYVDEPSDAPMELTVYPGADATSSWYDDDGRTFDYRKGEWMRVLMSWNDRTRRLSLRLAPGSKRSAPVQQKFVVRIAGTTVTKELLFNGRPVDVRL